MQQKSRKIWLLPLITFLVMSANCLSDFVLREYCYQPLSYPGMSKVLQATIVLPFYFVYLMPLCSLLCYIAKRCSFRVAAVGVLLVVIATSLLYSFWLDYSVERHFTRSLPLCVFIWMPFLMALAKELCNNDKRITKAAIFMLSMVTAYMIWLIYTGRGLQINDINAGNYENQITLALTVGSWMAYYLMPRWQMPLLFGIAVLSAFCIVPALSWQVIIHPLFAALTYVILYAKCTRKGGC